jgi:hypothetical protein
MTGRSSLGPFEAVRDVHHDAPFPRLLPVRQKFDAPQVQDVAGATRDALEPLRGRVRDGMRVALTAGSRGIHDVPEVLRAAGEWLRESCLRWAPTAAPPPTDRRSSSPASA